MLQNYIITKQEKLKTKQQEKFTICRCHRYTKYRVASYCENG